MAELIHIYQPHVQGEERVYTRMGSPVVLPTGRVARGDVTLGMELWISNPIDGGVIKGTITKINGLLHEWTSHSGDTGATIVPDIEYGEWVSLWLTNLRGLKNLKIYKETA